MSRNYAINSNAPLFSTIDDDNMEAAFLQSSGGKYMASDKWNQTGAPQKNFEASSPVEREYQTTIQQIQDVEKRTLQSTKRSLQAIAESEQVGVETAKALVDQRQQLEDTNKRLDTMTEDLKESQKNISAIKSVFSSFRQWMTAPKTSKETKDKDKKGSAATSPTDTGPKERNFDHNPQLEKAVNIAPQLPDPSLKIRGIDYNESSSQMQQHRFEGGSSSPGDDWKDTTRRVNTQLDADLEEMSFGLSRLRGLAEGLGQEITQQNTLLDTINAKADRTDVKITSTNKEINSLLKK